MFNRQTRLALAAALAVLALPGAALADWDWTKWGMSVDAVISGSKGKVSAFAGAPDQRVHGYDRLAQGEIERFGLTLNAQFFFTADGKSLHVIRLLAKNSADCDKLKAAVTRQLGQPKVDEGVRLQWPDDGKGNFVAITAIPPSGAYEGICFVRYRPVAEAAA